MSSDFTTVAIWGVGLIGGSIGMALRQRGLADEVIGIGRSSRAAARTLPEAVRLGAVDRMVTDPAEALAEADLVVLAMPVQAMLDLAPQAARLFRPGTLVTDVASVKGTIVAAWEECLPDGVAFVGGHPMFGRERSGVAAASAGLVPGCRWVLTPGERADGRSVARLRSLVQALGAQPLVMRPDEHDRRAAGASHLPQMVATALAAAAQELDERIPGTLDLAAGGFRDATRIADSPADLWGEIWAHNRPALREAVHEFRQALGALEAAIESDDEEALEALFERAHAARRRLVRL
jgi:prephenate dehydrogenase